MTSHVEDGALEQEVDEVEEEGVAVFAREALVSGLDLLVVDNLDLEFVRLRAEVLRDGALGRQDAQVAHLLCLGDSEVLPGHLGPVLVLVDQAEEKVGIRVGPIGVQNEVKVLSGLVVVFSLNHEGSQEQSHIDVNLACSQLNLLVDALLSLNLLVVFEAELSEFGPLFAVVGVVNELVDEVLFGTFDFTNCVKFARQAVELFILLLPEALEELVVAGPCDRFELRHDV